MRQCFYIPQPASRRLRAYYNDSAQLAGRFKKITSSIGAYNLEQAKQKIFTEIDDVGNNAYVELLVNGLDGAVGYGDIDITEQVKRAASNALAEFIF